MRYAKKSANGTRTPEFCVLQQKFLKLEVQNGFIKRIDRKSKHFFFSLASLARIIIFSYPFDVQSVFIYKSTRTFFHMRSGHFSNISGKLYLDLVDHIGYCLQSEF